MFVTHEATSRKESLCEKKPDAGQKDKHTHLTVLLSAAEMAYDNPSGVFIIATE